MSRVVVLCTDPLHPVNAWLEPWAERARARGHHVDILRDRGDLTDGDFLFLVSCHQIIRKTERDGFRHTLVLHASDLPRGRGMSPHIWPVVEGGDELVLSLLNAEDALDSGDIWAQRRIPLDGTELFDDINRRLFEAEIELMDWALENCDRVEPRQQSGEASFFRKRTPEDSRIDPDASILSQFNLLRVADPDRYPAFFDHQGQRYRIRLEKMG